MSSYPDMYSPRSSQQMLQRRVIVQKDQNGYGLAVTRDNPVFVQSVKDFGAAYKAGVQTGDRIIKVNGTLVTSSNHQDVVKMIKSGSYVQLTLLGEPPGQQPVPSPGIQRNADSRRTGTSPQPVNSQQESQVKVERLTTFKRMLERERTLLDHTEREYAQNPSEKLQKDINGIQTRISVLEKQLQKASSNMLPAKARIDQGGVPQIQMATVNTVEVYNAPAVSEVSCVQAPGAPVSQSPWQGQGLHPGIMCMDEDDFQSDNEPFEDHGPFLKVDLLEKKSAHMSVFLHYLISNSDPTSLFFYIVTDSYATGNLKEMKKWVYDIFSTFLADTGPLKIQMDENIVASIEHTINTQLTNEDAMRNVFLAARTKAKEEVEELLGDFCQKRALGLGSIYGDQLLSNDDMDRSQEAKIVESTLMPHLDRLTTSEAEKEPKNQALAASLITFMKQSGVRYQSALERAPSFMNKDKQRLQGEVSARSTKKHSIKGHTFIENHYLKATFCDKCKNLLWGIGCQGLQCTNCEYNVHRTGPCLEQIPTDCPGKRKNDGHKKRKKFTTNTLLETKPQPAPPSTQPQHIISLKPENEELAQLTKNIDVHNMVDQFEGQTGPRVSMADSSVSLSSQDGTLGSSGHLEEQSSQSVQGQTKKKNLIRRSASLKHKGEEKKEGRRNTDNKRSRRSQDSPRASLEQLAKEEEPDSDLDAESNTPNWQKNIDKDIVKKLEPKEVKRQEVINELFHTERTHVRQLKVLKKVFYQPMLEQEILTPQFICYIFPNIDDMIDIHSKLNNVMKKDRKTSHVIAEVGGMLLDRFNGEAGEEMKKACAAFCENQSIALEHLKKVVRKEKEKEKDKKEGSIARFMEEAESNPLCRRLPLAGIMATGYQRLTKYPLLIENLLKYTTAKSHEHEKLIQALEKSKDILAYVNQAVRESENRFRLLDYNTRMDRTPLDKSNNALVADYKNFDLSKHKLIHDGALTWKVNRNKSIEVQVLLLEELIVLLTKQDEKLILKLHSTTNQYTPTHSPIVILSSVLCRPVATNKKGFFLVSTSAAGPQIYELLTQSTQDRTAWMGVIHSTQDQEPKQAKGGRRNARTVVNQRQLPLPLELNPVYEESPKGEDQAEIINPPEVANSDIVIAPEPEVITQNGITADAKSLDSEPSGDKRTALKKTVQQVETEDDPNDRLQSVIALASRSKPVLDERVGESSENAILAQANELMCSRLSLVQEQFQSMQLEMMKMKQDNQETLADNERLKQELTVTKHELNNLQTERLQNNPAGSVDSIPKILDDDPNDRLQSVIALASRSKPGLDEVHVVGGSSENAVLAKAHELMRKELTLFQEQFQSMQLEMMKMKQDNQTLETAREETLAFNERLKQELTMTKHELNNLQTDRLQNNPAGSVDSIPNILDDDRLTAEDKQRNRQSYSGDSSATESEDSKTVESSEADEPTVVHDDEGSRSFNEHDSDVPLMPNTVVTKPEVFQVVNSVVNEQLLELQSRTVENEIERTAAASEASEESASDSAALNEEMGSSEENGSVNEKAMASLDDSQEEDETVGNRNISGDVEEEEDVFTQDNAEETTTLDINRNSDIVTSEPATITPECEVTIVTDNLCEQELLNVNMSNGNDIDGDASNDAVHLEETPCETPRGEAPDGIAPSHHNPNGGEPNGNVVVDVESSSGDGVLLRPDDSGVADADPSCPSPISEDSLNSNEMEDSTGQCLIEVMDKDVMNSAHLVTNTEEEAPEALTLETEGNRTVESQDSTLNEPTSPPTPEPKTSEQITPSTEMITSELMTPSTEPITPEPLTLSTEPITASNEPITQEPMTPTLEPTTPEVSSRPASIVSQDSASSDVLLSSTSIDESDRKKSGKSGSQDLTPPAIIEETEAEMV